jgi:hypothetical protein
MPPVPRRTALVFCLALPLPLLTSLAPSDALAATAYESPYTFDQTWSSAIRLVRVDLGLKITEKDPEHGYFLFEYTSPESGKRVHAGAMEIVKLEKGGARASVQLPDMPSYHERMIVDALAKKLVTEYGDPPKKPDPPPPAEEEMPAPPEKGAAP